jgi:hypothetical protein
MEIKHERDLHNQLTLSGADAIVIEWDMQRIVVSFRLKKISVIFRVPLPDPLDSTLRLDADGKQRPAKAIMREVQTLRSRQWRQLSMVIRWKLVSVASGIESVEEAFMAQLLLRSGETMSEWIKVAGEGDPRPQLALPEEELYDADIRDPCSTRT